MDYVKRLEKAVRRSRSLLCVGLDPNPELIPDVLHEEGSRIEETVEKFCLEVIDATAGHCCAYKPNLAFFEALGPAGMALFERILTAIPDEKIVIADAKRGDIGSTAEQYRKAFFDYYDVDAVTLNPLMGFDTLDPYINDAGRAVYTLVLTSNSGAHDLLLRRFEGRISMAEYLADQLSRKMEFSATHLGMVIGATHDSVVEQVLSAYPEASLLIPGIGSQGGSVESLAHTLRNHRGIPLISSSRSILYAGSGKSWKSDVDKSAKKTNKSLKKIADRYV